jgi:hypothetical protein
LALLDFWLLGRIKTGLAGPGFVEPEELFEDIRKFLERIPAAELTAVFKGSIDRVRCAIALMGRTIVAKCYAINLGFRLSVPGSAAKTY